MGQRPASKIPGAGKFSAGAVADAADYKATLPADVIAVSDAGSPAVNGLYKPNGTMYLGAPLYQKTDGAGFANPPLYE